MRPDFSKYKNDFPILSRSVRGGNRLIYLDSGATSQKPESVITAEANFYRTKNAAVHRGAHLLAEEASEAYENARSNVANFIGAEQDEVIFTKSATESLNFLATSFGNPNSKIHIKNGDEIVVSEMEHHANLIPWQQLASRVGAKLKWFPVGQDGRLDLSDLNTIINQRTKIVAITHQSNVLGTILPVKEIVASAKRFGAYAKYGSSSWIICSD
jgi:cysteine desulfurase/selenocysteine lyase